MVSYTTSEIYHRVVEKNKRYKAAIFPEHYALTEFGAITKASAQKNLAQKFLSYLVTPAAQKILAENNWMYPALSLGSVPGVNSTFAEMPAPGKTFVPKRDAKLQKKLVESWLKAFQ